MDWWAWLIIVAVLTGAVASLVWLGNEEAPRGVGANDLLAAHARGLIHSGALSC